MWIFFRITAMMAILSFYANDAVGQKVLLLEKTGRGKHYMYRKNDRIKLKPADTSAVMKGRLTAIADSFLILSGEREIRYSNIEYICRPRAGIRFMQEVFLKAGIPYILLSGINRTINREYPVFDNTAIFIGGGLTVAGIMLTPLSEKKIRSGRSGWKLKILDYDLFD